MSEAKTLRHVGDGTLSELDGARLVYTQPAQLPSATPLVLGILGAMGLPALTLSIPLREGPLWSAVAVALALVACVGPWLSLRAIAQARSRLPCLRRRLVVERVDDKGVDPTSRFSAVVDGVTLGPTSRRGLYWRSLDPVWVFVLVVDDRAVTIFSVYGKTAGSPSIELGRAKAAIVDAERASSVPYRWGSILPLVHGLVTVLDLGPDRTHGPPNRGSFIGPGALALAGAFGSPGWRLLSLWWLSEHKSWFSGMNPVLAGCAFGLATLALDAALYGRALRWFQREFNSIADSLIASTPA